MAVYEHSYKPYEGKLTSEWSRFLVLPRYAYQDLFKYKMFLALFLLCFIGPLVATVLVYLHHNAGALMIMNISSADVVAINGVFFYVFTSIQSQLAFLFTVIIGPVLISRDLANNALPLYLCRPFTRFEYIVGKMSVLLILLSTVTWIPMMLVFLFQSYLEGGAWFRENLWIGTAIMTTCLAWLIALSLLAMAFSAWIKWRTAASAALFAILIIPTPIGFAIQEIFRTNKGHMLRLGMAWNMLSWDLFGVNDENQLFSAAEAWMVFAAYGGLCLLMLWRKVRAYEVVS
jgi:ABC-2 type transport system permease protein